MNTQDLLTAEILSADYDLDRFLVRVVYDGDPYLVLFEHQTSARVMDERKVPDCIGDTVKLLDGLGNIRVTACDAVHQVRYREAGPE